MSERNGRTVSSIGTRTLLSPHFQPHLKPLFESLESRQLMSVVTLSTGQGPGGVKLPVDAYGAFGIGVTGQATQVEDFTVGDVGVIDKSYVYFSPLRSFLAEDEALTASFTIAPVDLPEPTITSQSANTLVSSFRLTGTDVTGTAFDYDVVLFQSLAGPQSTGIQQYFPSVGSLFQSVLTQTYQVTNRLGTANSFNFSRVIQTQPSLLGFTAPTYGQVTVSADGGRTLSAVEAGGFFANSLSIRSFGGSFAGGGIRESGLDSAIAVNNGLPATFFGVENGTDSPSDEETTLVSTTAKPTASLAQSANFVVGPRQTVVFTTQTVFAEGAPVQLLNTQLGTPVDVQGNFAFSAPTYNYDFPRDVNGALQPLTVTINRLGGTQDAVDPTTGLPTPVTVLITGVSSGNNILISPIMVTFAAGQTSANVSIPISANTVVSGTEPSTITLSLSTTTPGAGIAVPGTALVNILPANPVFAFVQNADPTMDATTYTGTEGQPPATITIRRSGNINGAATVTFTTLDSGTARAGQDYDAFSQTVTFADGETTKTVQVTVRDDQDEPDGETVNLALLNNVGQVLDTAVLVIDDVDAFAPRVSSLTTVTDGRSITAVQLNFSEALLSIGSLDSFSLFSRTAEGGSGSAKLKEIEISSVSYNPGNQSITVVPARRLAFNRNYQISLRPDPGLVDTSPAGNQLNQNPVNGVASYIALFSRGTHANYVDRTGDVVTLNIRRGNFELVRDLSGEASTVTLFGDGSSLFTGRVRARPVGTTSIARLVTNGAAVALPQPEFTVITTV